MNKITLKSALKSWQEIIFIISLGILVFGITMNISVAFQQVINVVFYCIFALLLVCLIGQFFWKNLVLGIYLACLLGFGSLYMILAAVSDLAKLINAEATHIQFFGLFTISELIYTILALCFSVVLTVAAISMPRKYLVKVPTIQKMNV